MIEAPPDKAMGYVPTLLVSIAEVDAVGCVIYDESSPFKKPEYEIVKVGLPEPYAFDLSSAIAVRVAFVT